MHKQDLTQGQFFLKQSLTGFNSEFLFSYTGYNTKVKRAQSALLFIYSWK